MKYADEELEKIIKQTSYLPEDVTVKYRLSVINGATPKTCKACGKYIEPQNIYCSKKCSANSQTTKDARAETNKEIYGETDGKLPDVILQKRRKLAQQRYGEHITHHGQTEEHKKKVAKNNMKKYGVTTTLREPETMKKIEQTNIKNLGVANPFDSPIIQEQIKQIILEKYGVENVAQAGEVQEQMKQTNIIKYGTPFSSQKHISQDALDKCDDPEWLHHQYYGLKKRWRK